MTLSNKPDPDNHYDSTNTPFHHLARTDGNKYSTDIIRQIQVIYLIAVIIWIVLILACRWYETGIIGFIFLSIPILVFGINFYFACNHTIDLENEMFQGNYLSFAFLVAIILINWSKINDKRKMFKILMIALILIMFSLIDIWTSRDKIILVKHVRTVLQTTALVLLAYALYSYYSEVVKDENMEL